MGQQHQVLPLARAGRTRSPGEVAAWADTKNLAQTCDGEALFRRIDELEPHRLPSLAKKAVACLEDLPLLAQDLVLAPQPLQLGRHVLLALFGRIVDLTLAAAIEPVAQGRQANAEILRQSRVGCGRWSGQAAQPHPETLS